MQDVLGSLMNSIGSDGLAALGGQAGTDGAGAQRAVAAALPALLGALARNSADNSGAASLAGALERDHDGSILDNLGGFLQGTSQGPGEAILGHVLGSRKQVVETNIARSAGIDLDTVRKLLPMLAPIVMAYLARQKTERSLDAAGLASMLGGASHDLETGAPGMLGQLLDADGDGEVTDDILKMGGNLLGGLFGGRK